ERVNGAGRVPRGDHAEALDREEVREQPDDLRLVLHEQHGRAHERECAAVVAPRRPFSADLHRQFPGRSARAGALACVPALNERSTMSRLTMTLIAAAAAAIAAIAVVALPAIGDDPGNGPPTVKQAPDLRAYTACLRTHGLSDAPSDPEAFKPWLAGKQASDPRATKAAL